MPRNILITGATGKTGAIATRTLLERGHNVRALVRKVDDRSDQLAAVGAEVVVGDLLDLGAMSQATKGIDAAYLTYPIAPGLLEAAATLLQAAEENGVGAILDMSQKSARRDAASNAARQHWLVQRVLDHFGGITTHIRPTLFAEWLFSFLNKATGELRLPFADARVAPIAAEDSGRVIAAILENPEPHAGKAYELFGSAELSYHEIAEAMSRVLGRTITYVPIDDREFADICTQLGFNQHFVQHLTQLGADVRNGVMSGTGDNVQAITGVGPLSVETFVDRNKKAFQQ